MERMHVKAHTVSARPLLFSQPGNEARFHGAGEMGQYQEVWEGHPFDIVAA